MSEERLLILPLFIPSLCQLSKPPFAASISWTNKKINVYSAVSSNLSKPWVVLHRRDSYRTMNLADTLDAYSKGVALHPQTLNRCVSGCGAESVRIRAKQFVHASPLNIHWAFSLFSTWGLQVQNCSTRAITGYHLQSPNIDAGH